MNKKELVHAMLEGKRVENIPVTVPYNQLYYLDHFTELTGRPMWQAQAWRYMGVDEHMAIFRGMLSQISFDIVQPQLAHSHQAREDAEFIEMDGEGFLRSRRTGEMTSLKTVSGHAFDDIVNEKQFVFSKQDAREAIRIIPAEKLICEGITDYVEATVSELGSDHFILTAGVLGPFYGCVEYLGLTNLFYLAAEQPELIDYMCQRNLEKYFEIIRQWASAGGDAIYIDDATMTKDMVSVRHYERFSLPYIQQLVGEIHRQGHKAILIYFGGVSDRLEQIAASGADGLLVETSMKGYMNDIGEISRKIGQRMTVYGNIDPIRVLQDGSDQELGSEIQRQVAAASSSRGFILSTGSPITPSTPLKRMLHFMEIGRQCKPNPT